MRNLSQRGWALLAIALASAAQILSAAEPAVRPGDDGKLVYATDDRGNRIPDFSHCGYAGAGSRHPRRAGRRHVAPAATATTQREFKPRSTRSPACRSATTAFAARCCLRLGEFQVAGQLRITASGVVLRGTGAGEGRHDDRRHRAGSANAAFASSDGETRGTHRSLRPCVDEYVPVGAAT